MAAYKSTATGGAVEQLNRRLETGGAALDFSEKRR
jgi:hypothetical protein